MTKEAGFLETTIKDTKTVSGSKATSNTQEVKTAPSLFDSMLSDAKNSQENINQNDTTVQSKKTDTPIESKDTSKNNDKEPVKEKVLSNASKTPSLLDKLVDEASKQIKTQNLEESLQPKVSKENVEVKTTTDITIADNNKSKEQVTDVETKILTSNKEQNNTSLMDKLIKEANEQIKDELQINTKGQNNPNTTKDVQQNVTDKLLVNESLTTKVENIRGNDSTQSTEIKTSTKDEKSTITEPKTSQTVSLLDKLLQEANSQIENESVDTNKKPTSEMLTGQVKNEQNTTQELSLMDKLIQEANSEIENESVDTHKKPTSEMLTGQVKNEQNTTQELSLMDKLIQEANSQIENESNESVDKNTNEKKRVEVDIVKTIQVKEVSVAKDENTVVQVKDTIVKESVQNDSKVVNVQTQVVKEQTSVTTSNVNEKVASELAKVSETNDDGKVSLTKEQVNNIKTQTESPVNTEKESSKSLIDRLLDNTKVKIDQENTQANVATASNTNNAKMPTESILTNIYLSSLNKTSKDAFLEKTHEVKTMVANATSVKDVHKGADLLNLGLQSSEVIVEEEQFKENVKNEFLNKLSVTRDIIKHDITKMNEEIVSQSKAVKNEATAAVVNNALASNNLPEVDINVSAITAYNIENRIIGARQHMNSMMSDIARNMYLNYKPPVTAFRMNLNPGNLGSIAVLIKSDKESGLSISLNMSNVATLDSFVDNQAALRASLAKNFNTNTNINLEFNMQDGQQQGNNGQENKRQQQQNHRATNDILESLNNNSESATKVTNYM